MQIKICIFRPASRDMRTDVRSATSTRPSARQIRGFEQLKRSMTGKVHKDSPRMSSLHDVVKNRQRFPKEGCKLVFLVKGIAQLKHHRCLQHQNGGAERDRTADPLLAKQVLSQLSYSPNFWVNPDKAKLCRDMVGPGRLELPTPRLSSVCSNQLSYGPLLGPSSRGFAVSTPTPTLQ